MQQLDMSDLEVVNGGLIPLMMAGLFLIANAGSLSEFLSGAFDGMGGL